MQIQELEAELGVPLVERRPGEVALTDVGLEVARRAERVLAATRDLADFARHRGRLLTGRLQLGVIPSIAPYVLPKILPVLQRRYPDLRVELRETQTARAGRGAASRRARRDHAGAAGRRRRDREHPRCSTTRSCWRCRPPTTARRARASARGHRHAAADPAGGGPLPARPGAGVLLQRAPRREPRRDQPRDRDADGGERLRHHAVAARRGRRRGARRARQAVALCRACARPHRGPGVAAHLAAQGGFRGAGPAHHRDARRG